MESTPYPDPQRRLFQRIVSDLPVFARATDRPNHEGLELYSKQIHTRLITVPAATVLVRCQRVWGPQFMAQLLSDYFREVPPGSAKLLDTLLGLPLFISEHSQYGRVLALADLAKVCLRAWACIHGPDPETLEPLPDVDLAAYYLTRFGWFLMPIDPIDLHALWEVSAAPVTGDPALFWREISCQGPIGLLFNKRSSRHAECLPFHPDKLPLLQYLGLGNNLRDSLSALTDTEAQGLRTTLATTLAAWRTIGILETIHS